MSTIKFEKGMTINFADLAPNTIALDGVVQGPQLDPANRRFSFDHHAGCIRLVTKATCEQVLEAIKLGLPIDADTVVLTNDIDADTVLSAWLILNPDRVYDAVVEDMVARVGKTDAHGPIFAPHPLHREIMPPWGKDAEKQSMEMLMRFINKVSAFVDGELELEDKPREQESTGFGWSARTGWQPVEVKYGFADFYKAGYVLGFLSQEAQHGTVMYTVAKASDLVAAPLGPGSTARPVTDVDQFDKETILGALGVAEQEKNPNQELSRTWGGGSSIGGSPRNADGSGSCLTPDEVLAVFKRFVS